jgi:hypothetical protein
MECLTDVDVHLDDVIEEGGHSTFFSLRSPRDPGAEIDVDRAEGNAKGQSSTSTPGPGALTVSLHRVWEV